MIRPTIDPNIVGPEKHRLAEIFDFPIWVHLFRLDPFVAEKGVLLVLDERFFILGVFRKEVEEGFAASFDVELGNAMVLQIDKPNGG